MILCKIELRNYIEMIKSILSNFSSGQDLDHSSRL